MIFGGRVAPELAGDGVHLRAWRPSDAEGLWAACQDETILRWTRLPNPYTIDCARAFVAGTAVRRDGGQPIEWAIVDPESDALRGSIGLVRVDPEHQTGEVGFWLARDARGRGYATRALRVVVRWALQETGFERVEAAVQVDNLASQAVVERARFVPEGVLRSWRRTPEGRADFMLYALVPDDLSAGR